MSRVTELLVNGKSRRVDADGERSLLSVMCDDLELTGNKFFARAAAADCNRHGRW
jgi:aerobic-type carbon monoxide dehydrogenase small subunit (CoxS/CutS family)